MKTDRQTRLRAKTALAFSSAFAISKHEASSAEHCHILEDSWHRPQSDDLCGACEAVADAFYRSAVTEALWKSVCYRVAHAQAKPIE